MIDLNTSLSWAYHEAGHAAIVYWRNEALHSRLIVLHADRPDGSMFLPMLDLSETDLMVLLGGPLAELLAFGCVPVRPLRFRNEYRHPNSDTTRIRKLVTDIRGKDDRKYQYEVQERCREIIEHPKMWRAISIIAEKLETKKKITGEECDRIFRKCGAPQLYPRSRKPRRSATA